MPNSPKPEDHVKTLRQAKELEMYRVRLGMVKIAFTVATLLFITTFCLFTYVSIVQMIKQGSAPTAEQYLQLWNTGVEVFKIAAGI